MSKQQSARTPKVPSCRIRKKLTPLDSWRRDLPTLIDIKSMVGRAKDKLVVAELLVILEEREKGRGV